MNHIATAMSLATVLLAATMSPASAATTTKSKLVGPDAAVTCATPADEAWDGENISFRGPGSVVMDIRGSKIASTVTLKHARPHTDYVVKLIQGPEDCHADDGVIRTDRRGNGSLTRIEFITSHAAQTIIHAGDDHWRAKKGLKH